MRDYITSEELNLLLGDINQKLADGDVTECRDMLDHLLEETKPVKGDIDKDYIGNLKEKKKSSKIAEINRLLDGMTLEQIDNVRQYAADEYDEPNHEAEALDAIMQLSRKKQK